MIAQTQASQKIRIPYGYTPREYQTKMLGAIPAGYKRYIGVWHRRAGKDKTAFNFVVSEAVKTKAVYYYFLPTYQQGRKIVWEGIDPRTGIKFLDHVPDHLLAKKNDSDMKLVLTNGSLIQVVGTDNWNSIMGTPPYGCVFSEYSLQDPRAWDYIRPILRENGGWAMFIYTPRGRNHGFNLYKMALRQPDWFVEKLTVRDTKRDDGSPVITEEDIEKDREEGMDENLIEQEYYCSFEGAIQGSYYAKQIKQAREDKRVTTVPYVQGIPVDTYWDLGMNDSMSIWFVQPVMYGELRVIEYYENNGEGFAHYHKYLQSRPYIYGTHYMPHDVKNRELATGISRQKAAEELGIRPIQRIERPKDLDAVNAGIEACRMILSRCYFDESKCQRGLEALESYQKVWDEENKVFKNRPLHNWASNGADAFRTFAVGFRDKVPPKKKKEKKHWLLQ